MHSIWFVLCAWLVAVCRAKVHLNEKFDGDWQQRWVQSKHKDDYGKFELTAGKYYNDASKDRGLKTTQDARFYALSAKLPEKFSNKGKTLVVQYTVKHEQSIDCGGGYVKIMKSDIKQEDFHGETPYHIMFGPDICGSATKKVHFILNYKGANHQVKKEVRCKDDELTHLYRLVLLADNTYEILIDGEKVENGELEADFDLLPPKKIKDPDVSKPGNWDDREHIPDADDTKPEDWDQPEHVPDPDAKKPEDWDEEMDGEWEPPMIDNPDYKGEWKAKEIPNPDYKGKWIQPEIDNPEYTPDDTLYQFADIGALGFDLWQVKSGSIFGNIAITDSIEEADNLADEILNTMMPAEKKMKEKADEEMRKKLEEEEQKRKEEEDEQEDKEAKEPIKEKEEKEEKSEEEKEEDAHDEL